MASLCKAPWYPLDDDVGGDDGERGDVPQTVSDEVIHEERVLMGELHPV